ncbi:MAG: alpha/beta fold hydrolase [Betaproteobacteria bacterium]
MSAARPFWREAGSGPGVVCVHANGSGCGQWRTLMARLADRFTVLAPDSYGCGRSPEWPSDRTISLQDEVDLIEPVFERAGDPFVLVGHSYGAAVALRAAIRRPERVRALVVYEPTLFSLIDADAPAPNDADGIRQAVASAAAALETGDPDAAARCFIDYWTTPGSWARTPDEQKPVIAQAVRNVRRWAHALFTEPTPLAGFARLGMPVLYLSGALSTPSAHGVDRRLVPALRNVTHVRLPGLGHMGPVTHPDVVNHAIEEFLLGLGQGLRLIGAQGEAGAPSAGSARSQPPPPR